MNKLVLFDVLHLGLGVISHTLSEVGDETLTLPPVLMLSHALLHGVVLLQTTCNINTPMNTQHAQHRTADRLVHFRTDNLYRSE